MTNTLVARARVEAKDRRKTGEKSCEELSSTVRAMFVSRTRHADNHQPDGCDHQELRHLLCGSERWPYRGINPVPEPIPMGHDYCGIVEEVGSAVTSIKPGPFVIGSFFASDNTCPKCQESSYGLLRMANAHKCPKGSRTNPSRSPLLRK
jgi:Alcohol dehydrogenase GroES-like domain